MKKDEMFTVFITKYALTKGIEQYKVKKTYNNDSVLRIDGGYHIYYHGEGKEWHRTHESAVKKAKEIRKNKIILLKKQLEKIRKLKF